MTNITGRNINILSEANFQIDIGKLKYLNPHCTGVNIPSLTLPNTFIKTGLTALPNPSDNIEWASLSIQFLVDEELRNWLEIFDWIVGIGFPNDPAEFKDWIAHYKSVNEATFSDATVIIQSNKKNPLIEVNFKNIFPLYLSEVQLRSDSTNEYVPCTANFAIESYSYRRIGV